MGKREDRGGLFGERFRLVVIFTVAAASVVALVAGLLWLLFDSGLTAPAGFVYSTF